MTIFDLKKDVRQGHIGKFYVFFGMEREGMRVYWERMAECSHSTVQFVDSITDVFKAKRSLLAKPNLYICLQDKDFMGNEGAWERLESALGSNRLILTLDSLDKRSKFYKRFEGVAVPFDTFTDQVLTYHIQERVDVSIAGAEALIKACNGSYGRILLEVDKLTTLCQYLPDWTPDEVLFEMLDRGVIVQDEQDVLFDLSNAILYKDTTRAYACMQGAQDIPPLKLVLVLYNATKRLLLVQSATEQGYSKAEISKETGLRENEIWGISKGIGKRSTEELTKVLSILRKVEQGIKGGILCEEHAMDYLMISLL